jgi:mannose-6-phosphate isomerase-like protein (cupin superfamily)
VRPTRYVFSTTHTLRYRFPTHTNELVLDRAEAETSEAFMVVLQPGEAPPLHAHPDTEQVFYIQQGRGILEVCGDPPQQFPVHASDLVRIPPHVSHRIHCEGPETLIYLSVDCFVGGRPLAEPSWESHVRTMCAANGWDFEQVWQGEK